MTLVSLVRSVTVTVRNDLIDVALEEAKRQIQSKADNERSMGPFDVEMVGAPVLTHGDNSMGGHTLMTVFYTMSPRLR